MAGLSKEQIDFIRSDLKNRKVSRSFLFEEWVDHVCCDVETLMNSGLDFNEAYQSVVGETGAEQVKSAHGDVEHFLNHGYVGIKKLLLFAFLVFAAGWLINLKDAGNWIGLVSFLILAVVYLRIAADFLKKRFVHRINILLSAFGFLAFLGTVTGILLIFLYRNYGVSTRGHGVDLTVFAWFFFALACLVHYIRESRSAVEESEIRKMKWFAWLSGINVFLAVLSIASFPLYRQVQGYLFYFILFLLAFDLAVFLVLLFTRSLKNTLVMSLVIGSFMIVFIHSHFRNKLPGGKPKLYELTLQAKAGSFPQALYISLYFDRFPDKPITLPLTDTGDGLYEVTMPSYAYRGYLYYGIGDDSLDAREYFAGAYPVDSIALNIPGHTIYQLQINKPPL